MNLYLGGGADTFNLVVPINCALNDEYMAVRGEAALGSTKLLEISSSQACRNFGLHYKLPKLRQLYQAGEAVAVAVHSKFFFFMFFLPHPPFKDSIC